MTTSNRVHALVVLDDMLTADELPDLAREIFNGVMGVQLISIALVVDSKPPAPGAWQHFTRTDLLADDGGEGAGLPQR